MATLPFINEAQIEAVLEWGPLMDILEKAMIAFSAGDVAQPVRQMVQVPGHDAIIAAMANTVIVESYDAARDQAGNIRGSECEIYAEIGEIYAGTKTVPDGATVIYDSVGMAIMDVAAAKLAYDLAK